MDGNILEVKDVSAVFDGFKALTNVNINVKYNEVHFLIGPNGAGKTTLLDIICGKTKCSSGKIIYKNSTDVTKEKDYEIVKMGIGRKFQAPSIFSNLSVYENMELALKERRNIIKAIFSKFKGNDKSILDILSTVNLLEHKDKNAGALSHGQKQWLEIAMLLLQKPELLLLDEPVAGMGKSETEKTGKLLKEISKHCSVIVVEHDMEFVKNFADTVSVLHEGKNLCDGSVEEVQNNEKVREVYIGRGSELSA